MLFKCIIILIHVLGDRVKDVYIDYFETEDYLPESSLVNTVEYIWQSHGFYNSLNCGLRAWIKSGELFDIIMYLFIQSEICAPHSRKKHEKPFDLDLRGRLWLDFEVW